MPERVEHVVVGQNQYFLLLYQSQWSNFIVASAETIPYRNDLQLVTLIVTEEKGM